MKPVLPTFGSVLRPGATGEDAYLGLVSDGPGRKVATTLGLPAPVQLRRHRPDRPLVEGPVVVLSAMGDGPEPGTSSTDDADRIAHHLLGRGLEIHRNGDDLRTVGAVVVCLTEVRTPADLSAPALELAGLLRKLAPGGRIVTLSRPALAVAAGAAVNVPVSGGATTEDNYSSVVVNAARQGVVGFLRSVAQEMRGGATANGIVVADGLSVCAPSVLGGLDFLLSGRSAFVDGQFLAVSDDRGPESLSVTPQGEQPFKDRVIVVTGAARGIGEQIAYVLHEQGARVVPVDVPVAGDKLSALANRLGTASLTLDVTADDAGRRILEHCRTRYGQINGIVHNAGITRDKLLANMDEAKFSSVVAVNAEAPLRITEQLLADPMAHGLRVVGLASTSGIAGNRGQTNYAASKAAVVGMTAGLAPLMAQRSGTANAVAPGFIETEMTAKIPAARRQVARRVNSLQQGGLPRDVAEAVAFLLSDAAAGINGQTLRVCGQNMVGA